METKEQKGITLIALIITIVVLLILAAIGITAIKEYNILDNAEDAAEKFSDKSEEELVQLKVNSWEVEKYSGSSKTFEEYLKEEYGESNIEDNGDETYTIMLASGNAFKVKESGKVVSTKGIYLEAEGIPLPLEAGRTVTGKLNAKLAGISGQINWSNENNEIATLSATTGDSIIVTGVTAGETKVTATCSGYSVEYVVKVRPKIAIGSYVEYDVSYTDMYQGTQYNKTNGWRYLGKDSDGNNLLISTAIPLRLHYHAYTEGERNKWWDSDTTLCIEDRVINGISNNFDKIPFKQREAGKSFESGEENIAIGDFVPSKRIYNGEEYDAIGDYFKSSTYANKIENVKTLTNDELKKANGNSSSGFKNLEGEALGLFDMQDLPGYTAEYEYWLASHSSNDTYTGLLLSVIYLYGSTRSANGMYYESRLRFTSGYSTYI